VLPGVVCANAEEVSVSARPIKRVFCFMKLSCWIRPTLP
jgi:hypothetical protein